MRMGFHWWPAYAVRKQHTRRLEEDRDPSEYPLLTQDYVACPRWATIYTDAEGEPVEVARFPQNRRERCRHCGEALWRLIRPGGPAKDRRQLVKETLCQFPTIGPKTAERLLGQFGHTAFGGMLEDNVYELLNLMDEDGELVFSDRQAQRMERALSGMEIAFGQGGYQPSEFVKRYLLPYTAFVKLKDLGEGVLPPYQEHFTQVPMTEEQAERYGKLSAALITELKEALRKGDNSLLGVVLTALLAWPDCCFRQEVVKHPHGRDLLAYVPAVFGEGEAGPKEEAAIALCKEERAAGRRVLLYSIYTGARDTTARLKALLEREGLKAAVLRSSVDTARREDWIGEQVDRGCEVLITHPDLVRTVGQAVKYALRRSGYRLDANVGALQ